MEFPAFSLLSALSTQRSTRGPKALGELGPGFSLRLRFYNAPGLKDLEEAYSFVICLSALEAFASYDRIRSGCLR